MSAYYSSMSFFSIQEAKNVSFLMLNLFAICHYDAPKKCIRYIKKKKHKAKPAHDAKKPTTAPLLYLKRTLALASSGGALSKPLPLLRSDDDFISPGPSSSPEESLYWIISLC